MRRGVYDLPRDPFGGSDPGTGRGSLAVEFTGTSVTSRSNVGAGPDGEAQLASLKHVRRHLHYVDDRYRGYFVVDVTRERLQADYFAMKTILDRTAEERFVAGFHRADRPEAGLAGDAGRGVRSGAVVRTAPARAVAPP